jgi:hypothetical protein
VNGVAPALIQDTAMLPGNNEELAKSESKILFRIFLEDILLIASRNPNRTSWLPRRDCRDCHVDGENWICDK